MRRNIVSLCLALLLLAAVITGCGSLAPAEDDGAVSAPVTVAALNGPTGVGLAPMMDDERFAITVYQSPDEITGKIITGEVDVAAIPSNLAAVLYNKTEGDVRAISTITLGVLYLVEDGLSVETAADLKGKTIYASGKGGVPEYVLLKLLQSADLSPESDVTVQWLGTHADVAAKLKADAEAASGTEAPSGTIALLPEPQVSILQPLTSSYRYNVLDLNQQWSDITGEPLPMGVLVSQKRFIEEREDDLSVFMARAKASVAEVNAAGLHSEGAEADETLQLLVDKGFFQNTMTAAQAIPNCNIVFDTAAENYQTVLKTFYQTLFEMEPKSVGGTLPDDAFYY